MNSAIVLLTQKNEIVYGKGCAGKYVVYDETGADTVVNDLFDNYEDAYAILVHYCDIALDGKPYSFQPTYAHAAFAAKRLKHFVNRIAVGTKGDYELYDVIDGVLHPVLEVL